MDNRKKWGTTLLVFGAASLVLPFLGIQLRIFNLFGPGQKAAGIAAIVVGGVLWMIAAAKGSSTRSLNTTGIPAPVPPSPGVAAAPPVPVSNACPKCGAKSGS